MKRFKPYAVWLLRYLEGVAMISSYAFLFSFLLSVTFALRNTHLQDFIVLYGFQMSIASTMAFVVLGNILRLDLFNEYFNEVINRRVLAGAVIGALVLVLNGFMQGPQGPARPDLVGPTYCLMIVSFSMMVMIAIRDLWFDPEPTFDFMRP